MRQHLVTLSLIVSLGVASWATAQSPGTQLFDLKKSQQELEIMRGILSTTLSFVTDEMKDSGAEGEWFNKGVKQTFWRNTNISAFYLYGQGAVFVVPISGARFLLGGMMYDLEELHKLKPAKADAEWQLLREQEKQVRELERAIRHEEEELLRLDEETMLTPKAIPGGVGHGLGRGAGWGISGGVPGGVVGGVPGGIVAGVPGGVVAGVPVSVEVVPANLWSGAPGGPALAQPPRPATTQAAPAPRPQSEEEVRKRLLEAQDKVKKRREEAEAKRQKLMESIAQIKVYLIETLANHGDSLTHVKPNEHITVILTSEEGDVFVSSSGVRTRRDVISIQKSVITDYKAGKLTLDALKQRVLQYST